jgi:hypothetical protein
MNPHWPGKASIPDPPPFPQQLTGMASSRYSCYQTTIADANFCFQYGHMVRRTASLEDSKMSWIQKGYEPNDKFSLSNAYLRINTGSKLSQACSCWVGHALLFQKCFAFCLRSLFVFRWLSLRLSLLASILILGIALFGVGFRESVSPAKLGVVLTYSLATVRVIGYVSHDQSGGRMYMY